MRGGRRRLSKHKSERRHAFRRFAERFGCVLSNATYSDMVKQIQDGRATFVRRQSNRITIWRLTYNDRVVRVAYDNSRHNIVTFMPEGDNSMHPNALPLQQLIDTRAQLYKQECTEETAKKIKAVEAQIAKAKAEVAAATAATAVGV